MLSVWLQVSHLENRDSNNVSLCYEKKGMDLLHYLVLVTKSEIIDLSLKSNILHLKSFSVYHNCMVAYLFTMVTLHSLADIILENSKCVNLFLLIILISYGWFSIIPSSELCLLPIIDYFNPGFSCKMLTFFPSVHIIS